ncbi:AraC family transcriptional regulator [Lentibacillus songyuanensis]|uniref:AraC family transcriptional regulator n=1 Tax=Lentibacillus songyuanensis TaxID=3136161 RepID=UPI0031BB24D4
MEQACTFFEWGTENIFIKLDAVDHLNHSDIKRLDHHFLQSHAIVIASRGQLLLHVDQQEIQLHACEAYACKPGSIIGIHANNQHFEAYIFYMKLYEEQKNSQPVIKVDGPLFTHVLKLGDDWNVGSSCKKIYRAWHRSSGLNKFRCQISFQYFLLQMIDSHVPADVKSCLSIEEVKQFIDVHYNQDMTVHELARLTRLSCKYFAEVFKKRFGKTVMEYVTELRMQAAKRLMNQGSLKVREIAHEIGYRDEFYFSRKFKKETGMTPTNYMKNVNQKIVAYTSDVIGHLIPLGLMPYAAPLHPKWTSYYYQHYRKEIPVPLSAYRVNEDWETNIMQLRREPVDTIITSVAIHPREQELLEKIAPVIYLPKQQSGWWRDQFLYIADKLGKTNLASKWLQAYDQKAAHIHAKCRQVLKNKKPAVIRMVGDSLFMETDNPLFSFLFEDLHLSRPHDHSFDQKHHPVTVDKLCRLPIDIIFMLVRQDNETRKHWELLKQRREWQQLPAVRTGNIKLVPSDPWLENSAHAHLRKLDSIDELCP